MRGSEETGLSPKQHSTIRDNTGNGKKLIITMNFSPIISNEKEDIPK